MGKLENEITLMRELENLHAGLNPGLVQKKKENLSQIFSPLVCLFIWIDMLKMAEKQMLSYLVDFPVPNKLLVWDPNGPINLNKKFA